MKFNIKKCVFLIVIVFILANLTIGNKIFRINQKSDDFNQEIIDNPYLRPADSGIDIITPENKTIIGPMAGYYPATYGFESDADGSPPKGWEEVSTAGAFYVVTNSSKFGHNKVLEGYDGGNGAFRINYYFDAKMGVMEFWMAHTSTATGHSMSTNIFNSTGSILFGVMLIEHNINIFTSTGQITVATYNINIWYHFRIEFRSNSADPYAALNQNQFRFYYNNTYAGTHYFENNGDPDYLWCRSTYTNAGSYYSYWDAFGFSWDPDYKIKDNTREGLLISFTNTTNLSWMGYSLDNQANKTIMGNTTIPMLCGPHNIQVFGNDSMGAKYYSDLRHFTVICNLTGNPILIDQSNPGYVWAKYAWEEPWCSGTGHWNDPYVIEYVLIDGLDLGNCIEIKNSNVYFIIRYCKVYNSGGFSFPKSYAGIKLNNTNNGMLINNNCSNNGWDGIALNDDCKNNTILGSIVNNNSYGIHLENLCNNNTILGNTLKDNWIGVYMYNDCDNNTLSENHANNNNYGIYLSSLCNNNTISGNTANNNMVIGIEILGSCDNNTISGNTANNNFWYGIDLWANKQNTVSKNIISYNKYGISISSSRFNTVMENIADNNNNSGICLYYSDNNNVLANFANNNNESGIYLDNSENSTISGNYINNNSWGIYLYDNCRNSEILSNYAESNSIGVILDLNCHTNNISENFIYFNSYQGIIINTTDCVGNIIKANILVSEEGEFIINNGINTFINLNYYGATPPSFLVEVIVQSFSMNEFVLSFCIFSETHLDNWNISIQMWWNGVAVHSNNITEIGNGLYNITLTPIFVATGEAPILLNMTISADYHLDTYFETSIRVEPIKLIQIEIIENIFSSEHFNFTFFIYDEIGQEIDLAMIQMWWNGKEISEDVINLGNGLYFISLDSITVAPGENPILLNMTISVDGFQDKYFETYIAIDPETLDKGVGSPVEFPIIIIIIIISAAGGIGVTLTVLILLRKRKQASETI